MEDVIKDFMERLEARLDGAKDEIEPKQPLSESGSHALRHTRYFHLHKTFGSPVR